MCGEPLEGISRIPVCRRCLAAPQSLEAEHHCVACRTAFVNPHPLDEEGLCALCRLGLNRFDAAYSFGSYEGVLRKLIHLLKYGKVRTLDRPLGALLSAALPREERFDAIVPLPLHWWRRWQRGFNQSELLAREVGRRTGLPLSNAVRRKRATPSQAGRTSAARRANVTGAFEARRNVAGLRLLLVDDVMTTGATVNACAAALKRAGAARVTVLTLARVDRRMYVSLPDTPAGSVDVWSQADDHGTIA